MDQLLADSVVTYDAAKRRDMFSELQEIILKKQTVIIPIFYMPYRMLIHDYVKNAVVNADGSIMFDKIKIERWCFGHAPISTNQKVSRVGL